jgi:undecaprenyl diphosphate synthase
MARKKGHQAGAENIESILIHAITRGVSVVSVYALSTDNLDKRPSEEVNHILDLFHKKLPYIKRKLHAENVRIRFVGDLARLPDHVRARAEEIAALTADNTRGVFVMAMAYGGRDEIVRAVAQARRLGKDDFTPFLDTNGLPPLDLVIRTGVDNPVITRLSDFYLWMSGYAEIYSTPVYWPAFTTQMFEEALVFYSESERKQGAVRARQDWGGF